MERHLRLWMQTPDGKQRREDLGGVGPQGECERPNEYVLTCLAGQTSASASASWPLPANSPP